jgi:hypothetical protein
MNTIENVIRIEPNTVRRQVEEFLSSQLRQDEITIGLLRYGAHLPHIYQRLSEGLGVQPMTLLISHMLEFFPRSWYEGKRFLILDDSVYQGVAMKEASERLQACGVPRSHFRTAALVVHERCPESVVDEFLLKPLSHHEYVAWKECLTAVVRDDVRPTERDHPLYYFSSPDLRVSQLVERARSLGAVHVSRTEPPALFKFTLTVDPAVLADVNIPGISVGAPCLVRFYCDERRHGDAWHITTVPIVATEIDMEEFLKEGGNQLAEILGLPSTFYAEVGKGITGDSNKMKYFFANRGMAALLLSRCLQALTSATGDAPIELNWMSPQKFDGLVNYCFPEAYSDVFHPAMQQMLSDAIASSITTPLSTSAFIEPSRPRTSQFRSDPFLPDVTQLACAVTNAAAPKRWDSDASNSSSFARSGATYRELLATFGDPVFVSAALDELLDDGMLRARDAEIERGHFARLFIPGGEYRALEVLRLATAWQTDPIRWTDEREPIECL